MNNKNQRGEILDQEFKRLLQTNGTLVYENANVAANENAVLPELKAGIYVLKVSGSSGETTKKIVRY